MPVTVGPVVLGLGLDCGLGLGVAPAGAVEGEGGGEGTTGAVGSGPSSFGGLLPTADPAAPTPPGGAFCWPVSGLMAASGS